MRPTRQARSEQTLERLLEATEQVLREKSFKEAGVAEIASRAGVTVGALYFRFADKESLLAHLARSAYAGLDEALVTAFRPLSRGEEFEERLRGALEVLADFYLEHRGVARAVTERSRSGGKLDSWRRSSSRALFDRAGAWIERSYAPAKRAGRARVNVALLFATTALRERIVLRDFWPGTEIPQPSELAVELSAAIVGYLRATGRR